MYMPKAALKTPLEVSKAFQEQVLGAIAQTQEVALAGVELWTKSVTPIVTQAPPTIDFPTPAQLIANSFGFAESLLAAQKDFAEKVVAKAEPVFTAASAAAE